MSASEDKSVRARRHFWRADWYARIYIALFEIQLALHAGLIARMLYTWSAIYHSQLKKGQTYTALQPVLAIWLLNDSRFRAPGRAG